MQAQLRRAQQCSGRGDRRTACNVGHVGSSGTGAAHALRDVGEVLEQLHVLVPWLAMFHLVKASDLQASTEQSYLSTSISLGCLHL